MLCYAITKCFQKNVDNDIFITKKMTKKNYVTIWTQPNVLLTVANAIGKKIAHAVVNSVDNGVVNGIVNVDNAVVNAVDNTISTILALKIFLFWRIRTRSDRVQIAFRSRSKR